VNAILARILPAAAVFIGVKLLESLLAELTAVEKEVKHKHRNIMPQVMRLVQGGKQ